MKDLTPSRKFAVAQNIAIDKSDVVAITTARIEADLKKKIKASANRIRLLKEAAEEFTNSLPGLYEKVACETYAAEKSKLLALFKGKAFRDIEVTRVGCGGTDDKGTPVVQCHIKIYHKTGGPAFIVAQCTARLPQAIKTTLKDIDSYKEDINSESQLNMSYRSKLQDIASIERAMRARIAELELSKSKDGTALLDAMTKDIPALIETL